MKFLPIITVILFFLTGCNESTTSYFNLSTEEFTKQHSDSLIIWVDQAGDPFQFEGALDLIDGKCNLELWSPVMDTIFNWDTITFIDTIINADTTYVDSIFVADSLLIRNLIYNEKFQAGTYQKFDLQFDRIIGDWKFYIDIEKTGENEPLGEYDFNFTYYN